jgi:phosphatidate cytidylyltransferase
MTQNLKLRMMTALVGAPVVLGLLFGFGVPGVALISVVVSLGMCWEFSNLVFVLPDRNRKRIFFLASAFLIHVLNFWLSVGVPSGFLALAPVVVFSTYFLFQVPALLKFRGAEALHDPDVVILLRQHFFELMAVVFGWVYCVWFPLLMVTLRQSEGGVHWLAFTLLAVWSADTFAYFSGSQFGKHRLFESVSPKKSWEGLAGGALGAVAVTQVYSYFFISNTSPLALGVMALTLAVVAAIGDLVESLFKRATDCKDSGSLLPGHGGFLDRFDGVVFALPVMMAFVWLLG